MKKTILLLSLACMLCLACACNAVAPSLPGFTVAPTQAAQTPPQNTAAPTDAPPGQTEQPDDTPTDAPQQGAPIEVDYDKLEAMLPAYSAVIRAGAHCEYNADDPQYFWAAIYYMALFIGTQNPLVDMTADTMQLSVPAMVVEEYAMAMFAGFSTLPPISQGVDYPIMYSEGYDAYLLDMTDGSDAVFVVTNFAPVDDETIAVEVDMYSYGDNTDTVYEFLVKANPSVGGINNPTFFYSVASFKQIQ